MSPNKSGNPYIDLLCTGLQEAGVTVDQFNRRHLLDRYDIVHIHWPAALIRWKKAPQAVIDVIKVIALLALARRRGSRVVWTAHDLSAHEKRFPFVYSVYERLFLGQVDIIISLTYAGIEPLRKAFPRIHNKPICVVPHGHYRDIHGQIAETPQESRKALALPPDDAVLLVFGQLRRYKGIDSMIRTFALMKLPNTQLLITGESKDDEHTAELQQLVAQTPNTSLRVERVAEEMVPRLLNTASVVLAPYIEGSSLNSGAALLSLSFNRPVVVRDTAVMRELCSEFGDSWIHLATNGQEAEAIASSLTAAASLRGAQCNLDRIAWEEVIRLTIAAYGDRKQPLHYVDVRTQLHK